MLPDISDLYLELRKRGGVPAYRLPLAPYAQVVGGKVEITPPHLPVDEAFVLESVWMVRKINGNFVRVMRLSLPTVNHLGVGDKLTISSVSISI